MSTHRKEEGADQFFKEKSSTTTTTTTTTTLRLKSSHTEKRQVNW